MKEILFAPPIAFLAYLVLGAILSGLGRLLAGPEQPSAAKSSLYASGEESPRVAAAPGYRQFFTIAPSSLSCTWACSCLEAAG
jgi:hypothetical protein